MPTKLLVLDFDNTLYPPEQKVLECMENRIEIFLQTKLGVSPIAARELRLKYYYTYGTTLRGLVLHHHIHPTEFFDFVQDVSLEFLPQVSSELVAWIHRVKENKIPLYLFTNSRADWPLRVLETWELGGKHSPFHLIFDIEWLDWLGKPENSAYQKVEEKLVQLHGKDIQIFFADDSKDNLNPAQERGWETIYVCEESPSKINPKFNFVVSKIWHFSPDLLFTSHG